MRRIAFATSGKSPTVDWVTPSRTYNRPRRSLFLNASKQRPLSSIVTMQVCTFVIAFCALLFAPSLITAIDVAVPSYIYPGGTAWNNIVSAGSKVKVALINPLNGPGFVKDTNYANQALAARAAGIKVFGYIHSTYGRASLDEMKRNVTTYYSWYAIDGIFVDEASTDCGVVTVYKSIYDHIVGYGGQVIINPGTDPATECYMSVAHIIMNAENSWAGYSRSYTPPSYVYKYDPHRFWHIVHTAPQSVMAQAVSIAVQRNAGYVFVTDADGAVNPYDKLPTYWSSFLATATAPPTPAPTTTQKPTTQAPTINAANTAPTSVSAVANAVDKTTLSWAPPFSGTVSQYRIGRDGSDSTGYGAWSGLVAATARSQTFVSLLPNTDYNLFVEAIFADGSTGLRVTMHVRTLAATPAPTTAQTVTQVPTTSTQAPTPQAPSTRPQTAPPTQTVSTQVPVVTAAPAVASYAIGITIDGGAGGFAWAASPESCDAQCQAMVGCLGWSYDMCGSGSCWLKTSLGSRVQRTCRASRVYSAAAIELPSDSNLVGRWNFGPTTTPPPAGFTADIGEAFGSRPNGMTYGWNSNNANLVQRNSPRSSSKAYDTFANLKMGGWWYHWEVALPAGYYNVRVVAGDPDVYECQNMQIENVPRVVGCPTPSNPWVEFNGVVTVTDGRLGITNTPPATDTNNKLCFVEIARSTGTVLGTTVTLLAAPSKRQAISEEAFVAALAEVSGQPKTRFVVLRSTRKSATEVHFEYLIADDPLDNATSVATSSEIATGIITAPISRWTMSVGNTSVLQEAGPVPDSYTPGSAGSGAGHSGPPVAAIVVPAVVVAVVICVAIAAVVAVVIIRRGEPKNSPIPPLTKRPSLASLINRISGGPASPVGSSNDVSYEIDVGSPPSSDSDVSPRSEV